MAGREDLTDKSGQTLYMAYGSNLWLHQMRVRCPTSRFLGMGRLNGYRWMINERGYANVAQTDSPPEIALGSEIPITNVSYGFVFALRPADERRLDLNEGVPFAYTKEYLPVEFWPFRHDSSPIDINMEPEKEDMLVYINRRLIVDDKPKPEYIYRMNHGIRDAGEHGMPQLYIDRSLRPLIPEDDRESARELAEKQALEFRDEA